ncbi:MAG TPA: PAS domain-containing sensor histidine kinase [Cytophagaceae bacterium]|jgi:PAS domain S-box-containing protein
MTNKSIDSFKGPINTSCFFKNLIVNAQFSCVFILDNKGIVLHISQSVYHWYGYRPEDIVGKNFEILFTDEDRLRNRPPIELEVALTKGSCTDNNYIVHRNGSHIWSAGESICTEDEDGTVYIVKNIYNINEQKLLENSLIYSNQQLLETKEDLNLINDELCYRNEDLLKMNKDLDNFVYTASHDLKGPINNIDGLTEALSEIHCQDENSMQLIAMMKDSIQKFKVVLSDLSTIGKAQQDSLHGASFIKFEEMFDEVKFSLTELINENKPIFHADFNAAPEIKFSRNNLRSVLYNLISNAIKYRSPARQPEITIKTEKVEDKTLLTISDNGLGIKQEDQPKVFSLYKRLHDHVEGTGVGMTIVKRIVENHGGTIEMDSVVGQGTTFRLFIKES